MPTPTPDPALGVNARFAIGASAPTDKPLDFASETLGVRQSFLDPQGLRGTRSRAATRVRANSRIVTGDVNLEAPTAVEMTSILPYITSAASASGTGNNYPLTEALSSFYADLLRGDTLFRYTGCRVNRATFSARKGTCLQCSLNIVGVDETLPGGAFPSLTLDTGNYFAFEDGIFTIATYQMDCFDFSLTIDNAVQARMVNSQTATVVYTTDRIITARIVVPWGDEESALYGMAVGGVAMSAVFTNGNTSMSFTAPKFQVPKQAPDVTGRDEIQLVLEGVCRNSGTNNDECVIFVDHSA
jgi:hypothetical protein